MELLIFSYMKLEKISVFFLIILVYGEDLLIY